MLCLLKGCGNQRWHACTLNSCSFCTVTSLFVTEAGKRPLTLASQSRSWFLCLFWHTFPLTPFFYYTHVLHLAVAAVIFFYLVYRMIFKLSNEVVWTSTRVNVNNKSLQKWLRLCAWVSAWGPRCLSDNFIGKLSVDNYLTGDYFEVEAV